MAESKGKDWRELCAAAAQEFDPEKLDVLVNQILQALDECDQSSRRIAPIVVRHEIRHLPGSALAART
jgi:cytochrome P450